MGTKEKLVERFLSMPKDFTFEELTRLLAIFGYLPCDKGRTSGSRVIFRNATKRPIMFHRPHPGNIVKVYVLRSIKADLEAAGLLK